MITTHVSIVESKLRGTSVPLGEDLKCIISMMITMTTAVKIWLQYVLSAMQFFIWGTPHVVLSNVL
ncbi:hypothetical protein AXF13_08185 [Desulfovibrio fairfieldensis]|uniref:Uncharacterized protein n=1 Tax=Desulfovibrio fairfieldensis TaxID=44742 RepID=A0A0X8JK01_9BACT|nr:hypothetical protein AXF13_08185 [Desulfovibrio fairfieldensis]